MYCNLLFLKEKIMKKQSQENFVKEYLLKTGYISRNFALSKRITRLAAIIHRLKKQKVFSTLSILSVPTNDDYTYVLMTKGNTDK